MYIRVFLASVLFKIFLDTAITAATMATAARFLFQRTAVPAWRRPCSNIRSHRYLSTSNDNKNGATSISTDIPGDVEFEEVVDPALLQEAVDRSLFTHEIKVRMPEMGEGTGKVLKWYKETGDVIVREDILCDIETPDFTYGMEIDDEELAVMGEILVPAGSDAVAEKEVICTYLHLPPLEKEKEKDQEEKV